MSEKHESGSGAAVAGAAPCSPTPAKKLNMRDRPGVIPIAVMRAHFESAMKGTPHFQKQPLGIMEINGQFSHYMNPETDTLWLGFAIGMRCAERLANEKAHL